MRFLREKKFMEARDVYLDLMRETNCTGVDGKSTIWPALDLSVYTGRSRAHRAPGTHRISRQHRPAYYYAQGAWEFAHGHPGDAKEWLKAAGKMFDEESTDWFARPLYSYGWLKGKPALPAS